MDAALKAVVEKFRASFTRRKGRDVREALPDQPLALPGSITVPTQASALPISSVVTEKVAHEAPGLLQRSQPQNQTNEALPQGQFQEQRANHQSTEFGSEAAGSEKASIYAQETPSASLQGASNSSGSNVVQIPAKAATGISAELIARCNENARLAKEKAEREAPSGKPLALPENNVVQLPMWPDAVCGVPNGMLRSALFGMIKKGPRRYMEGEEIAAQDGIEIRYTGQRLDQGDLDVWESILHICRFQDMGSQCRFTAYTMLKLLEMTDCGKNRETLHTRVMRLKANAVEVQQGRYTYFGSLLDEGYRDEDTHEYVVILNPKLRALFAADQFTQIDWSVRHALAGQMLAQWLHGYYSSHAQPFPVKVETIHKLCGSESTLMSDFVKNLRKALDALTEASNVNGQPFSYEILGDLLHVERKASPVQRRHLAKKAIRKLAGGKS